MDEGKRKKLLIYCTVSMVVLTAIGILVNILLPEIQKFFEEDDSILEAFMICENWKLPRAVGSEVESFNIAQNTNANQMNIINVSKIKSMDHLLIYNKEGKPANVLYLTISDSEYGEVIQKGKVIDVIEGEMYYEQLGPLYVGDDIQVRTWRKCCAKREDSECGVYIHRGEGKGRPPKISFLTPPVVDFDNWVKKLVVSKNNSLFIYSLLSGFGFIVFVLSVLLWKRRRKLRTTVETKNELRE